MHLDGERIEVPTAQRSFPDRWILSRLNATIRIVNEELERYRFDRASSALYQFIWHEYCDKYIEMIKPDLKDNAATNARATRHTLAETFETTMRLLHPFMPFITEEIWQTLPHEGTSIVRKPFPITRSDWESPEAEHEFALLEECRTLMNQERAILNYPAGKRLHFSVFGKTQEVRGVLNKHIALIKHMENLESLRIGTPPENPVHLLTLTGDSIEAATTMEDADLEKVRENVAKQIDVLKKEVDRLQQKLNNQDFVAKAPPDVRAEHDDRLGRESRMIHLLHTARRQIEWFISERKQGQPS
jgi:valyl-tRNA synthetase